MDSDVLLKKFCNEVLKQKAKYALPAKMPKEWFDWLCTHPPQQR